MGEDAGEPEPPELVGWHEFLDQRKELPLVKPSVCVKQFSRRIQHLSIDAAGRHGDAEFASEPLELHVFDASSSSRRWTRFSFLKNSTKFLAAASRAEAFPVAADATTNRAVSS